MAEPQKKMNLMQLTFIVAVNMMGSGIIMLPTNMAQVGAISLLSWIVTALGSMAIAYGFAQAGLFNQRAGGMAAYAEDAYGKAATSRCSSCTSCRSRSATSRSRSPRSATSRLHPLAVLDADRDVHRRDRAAVAHDLANFGGPSVTGKIGSVTVWGVILPVGGCASSAGSGSAARRSRPHGTRRA